MACRERARWGVGLIVLVGLVAAANCRRTRFPSRGDTAAVVVVPPHDDAAGPPKIAEQEPNDNPEQAQVLAINADWPVIYVEGSLAAPGEGRGRDVDVFKLLVPGARQEPVRPATPLDSGGQPVDPRVLARRLSLEIAPQSGAGLSVQLLDEGLKMVETISVSAAAADGMPNMAVSPGHTYYVRIKPLAKAGKNVEPETGSSSYKLSVQLGDFEVADEREPDDGKETAIPVVVVGSTELAGYHGWTHDQDFYRIPLPELPSALDVELDGVEGVTASLQVLDASGRLAFARGRKAERLALRNVILRPAPATADPASRFAYVVVRAESGQNRNQRYVLRLTLGAPKLDGEVEPNDSFESATPVRDGTYSGYLPMGDTDFFRYEGDGKRDVTFEASFPARVRGKLEAFWPGNLPAGAADSRKARQIVVLPEIATQGKQLYLRVSQGKGDGNANDPYALKITSVPTSTGAVDQKAGSANPALTPVSK